MSRQPKIKLLPQQIGAMLKGLREGKSYTFYAKKYGCHATYIKTVAVKHGVRSQHNFPKNFDDVLAKKARVDVVIAWISILVFSFIIILYFLSMGSVWAFLYTFSLFVSSTIYGMVVTKSLQTIRRKGKHEKD